MPLLLSSLSPEFCRRFPLLGLPESCSSRLRRGPFVPFQLLLIPRSRSPSPDPRSSYSSLRSREARLSSLSVSALSSSRLVAKTRRDRCSANKSAASSSSSSSCSRVACWNNGASLVAYREPKAARLPKREPLGWYGFLSGLLPRKGRPPSREPLLCQSVGRDGLSPVSGWPKLESRDCDCARNLEASGGA